MKKLSYLIMAMTIVSFMLSSCKPSATKSITNLTTAYNGESTASKKYADYAKVARTEGYDTIAKLFDAASKAEGIHAENHKKTIEKLGGKVEAPVIGKYEIKTTKENLEDAIKGETYEVETMYADFLKIADEEKCEDAKTTFSWAKDTEVKHAEYYKKALAALNSGNENTLTYVYYVCPKCGNTFEAANVDKTCSFCMTSKDKFFEI